MKKRFVVKVTYELLAQLLNLDDHKLLRVMNNNEQQLNERIDLVFEGERGVLVPEGSTLMYLQFDDLKTGGSDA